MDYTIRESAKAKQARLQISARHGLEVIIPQGFDQQQIPGLLQQKQQWIHQVFRQLQSRVSQVAPAGQGPFPTEIDLKAVDQIWQITYYTTASTQIKLTQHPQHLILQGAVHEGQACHDLLQHWLMGQGHYHFKPWLNQLAQQLNLSFQKLSVRRQKTRWGSCSSKQTISLNYKLLCLPSTLVNYVLIHELCHLVHPNHSKQFWDLVGRYEPRYRQLDQELRQAQIWIPDWLDADVY